MSTEVERTQETGGESITPQEYGPVYLPDVDIRETADMVEVLADMPGVDKASTDVTVENGVLSISGEAREEAAEGYTAAGREFRLSRYRRDFTISDQIDTNKIKARMADGVLTVSLPKREEVKTRKIKIAS